MTGSRIPVPGVEKEEFRRVEFKVLVAPGRLSPASSWLGHSCSPAPDYPSGLVSSCYYDTADWDSYFASVDGDFDKRKVRLRWYDEVPADGSVAAFLEVKEKEGFETWKRRVALNLDASLLGTGRFEAALPAPALAKALAVLGVFDGGSLRPAVLVRYRRQRFREWASDLRLSLDDEIEALAVGARRGWPPMRLPSSVIEVKGRMGELPLRLRGLRRFASVWSSHSKYSLAVDSLAGAMGPRGPR